MGSNPLSRQTLIIAIMFLSFEILSSCAHLKDSFFPYFVPKFASIFTVVTLPAFSTEQFFGFEHFMLIYLALRTPSVATLSLLAPFLLKLMLRSISITDGLVTLNSDQDLD